MLLVKRVGGDAALAATAEGAQRSPRELLVGVEDLRRAAPVSAARSPRPDSRECIGSSSTSGAPFVKTREPSAVSRRPHARCS